MRYQQGLTFAQIGDELRVSESAAHQMHTRALSRLKETLGLMGIRTARELC